MEIVQYQITIWSTEKFRPESSHTRVFNKAEKSDGSQNNKAFQSNAYTHVPRKDVVTILSKYKLVKDHRSAVAPKHLLKYSKKLTNVSPKKWIFSNTHLKDRERQWVTPVLSSEEDIRS